MARLTRLYTRSGDTGRTGLADGSRVDKASHRVDALGDLDELNAAIGLVITHCGRNPVDEWLLGLQHRLFDLGAELASPGSEVILDEEVESIEQRIDALNEGLPPLREFLLPGGNLAAAHAHLARTICRRAERTLWRLARHEVVNPASLRYLNRLSDLLFVLARVLARQESTEEPTWKRRR